MYKETPTKWSKELIEYYRSIDFSFWAEELICLQEQKIKAEKNNDLALKDIHNIKLYTTYLQLAEIFCLHLLVLSTNNLASLFDLSFDKQLKEFLEIDPSVRNKFLDSFLNNFVFGIQEKTQILDYEKKRDLYFEIFDEAMRDRNKDKNLLNAYKHGFRLISGGYMRLKNKQGKQVSPDFDTMITYYTPGRDEHKQSWIFENKISFFSERIHIKYNFILNMLENAKKVVSTSDTTVTIDTIRINKELIDVFEKSFGVFRGTTVKFKILESEQKT